MYILAQQFRELTPTQEMIATIVGLLLIIAVLAVSFWEDSRNDARRQLLRKNLGARLENARQNDCPDVDRIARVFADDDLGYADQLLRSHNY